jgi:hypothetical protein
MRLTPTKNFSGCGAPDNCGKSFTKEYQLRKGKRFKMTNWKCKKNLRMDIQPLDESHAIPPRTWLRFYKRAYGILAEFWCHRDKCFEGDACREFVWNKAAWKRFWVSFFCCKGNHRFRPRGIRGFWTWTSRQTDLLKSSPSPGAASGATERDLWFTKKRSGHAGEEPICQSSLGAVAGAAGQPTSRLQKS